MKDFTSFNLPAFLLTSLQNLHITTPTPVQALAVPPALAGRDILASAQTGSGKTLAFLLPLLNKLVAEKTSKALILLPTRELATQVQQALQQLLGMHNMINTALIIGGESMDKQLSQLKRRPQIVIGTPGRICDHLQRRTLQLQETNFLVLDEVDRMLDMGFSDALQLIRQHLATTKQTLMFSATLSPSIEKVANSYLENPERIAVGSIITPSADIKQESTHLATSEKFQRLLEELDSREGSVIVFVKTKRGADQLAEKLQGREHNADAIHGDLQQRKRDRVMRAFRQQKSRILVATDVAARGLDVPHIQHVINYDLPTCPEDYIHRIGRTGRAGASGFALSFVSPDDSRKWKDIQRLMQGKEMPSTQNAYAPRAQQPRTGGRPNPFQSHSKPSGFAPREGSRDSYAPRESSRDNYAPREGSREGYAPREASRAPREGYAPREASRAPREGYAPREGSREGYAPRERSREGYAPREGGFRGEPRANGGFRSESKPAFREGARPNPFKTDARPNPFKSDSRPNPFKTEGRANPFKSDARPSRFKTDGKPGQFKAGGKPNPFKSDAKPFKRKEESGSSTLTVANKDGFKKPGKFKAFFSKKRPA